MLRQLFTILPLILLAVSLREAHKKGGVPGLVSMLIAYMAGRSIRVALSTSLILLITAIITGYLATGCRLVRKTAGTRHYTTVGWYPRETG